MKKPLIPILLVLALVGVGYLLLPKGSHSFYGTRLLRPKPVEFSLEGPQGAVRLSQFRDGLVLIFFWLRALP